MEIDVQKTQQVVNVSCPSMQSNFTDVSWLAKILTKMYSIFDL